MVIKGILPCVNLTKGHEKFHKNLIITSRVHWAMSVCRAGCSSVFMSVWTQISIVIRARDTKFDMVVSGLVYFKFSMFRPPAPKINDLIVCKWRLEDTLIWLSSILSHQPWVMLSISWTAIKFTCFSKHAMYFWLHLKMISCTVGTSRSL